MNRRVKKKGKHEKIKGGGCDDIKKYRKTKGGRGVDLKIFVYGNDYLKN